MPKVARDPQGGTRRSTKPKASPTQQKDISGKDAFADLESGTSVYRLLSKQKTHSSIAAPSSPETMSGDEDNSEEEMYTDSLTSHTTASGSITADILTSTASAVEDISNLKSPSITESQFSPDMPYLQGSTQSDLTQDSVFTQQPSDSVTQDTSPSSLYKPPALVRSAGSIKRAPLCIFRKCTSIVQLFQMWLNHQNSDKCCMFLALYLMINYTILLCY